ncbi:MAG TPA: hypothetical protein VMV69_06285 [Pirellulales bacterium]|nr:hypothetical protein [Pirellulales bacterium]
MDTELLVDDRIDDGRKLIAELVRDGFDVTAAFWIKTSEEGLWRLYIVSKSVDTAKIGEGYLPVYACLRRIPDPCIALSDIRLVNATNPIARDAITVRDRYPGRIPARFQGKRLGNLAIEEAYIYPPASGQMTRSEVLQTAAGLMNRTGALQPSIVTFRDGSSMQAIPVGIDMQSPGTVRVVLHDIAAGADRVVSADDVVNIQ